MPPPTASMPRPPRPSREICPWKPMRCPPAPPPPNLQIHPAAHRAAAHLRLTRAPRVSALPQRIKTMVMRLAVREFGWFSKGTLRTGRESWGKRRMVRDTGFEPVFLGLSSLPLAASKFVFMPQEIRRSSNVYNGFVASSGNGWPDELCETVRNLCLCEFVRKPRKSVRDCAELCPSFWREFPVAAIHRPRSRAGCQPV